MGSVFFAEGFAHLRLDLGIGAPKTAEGLRAGLDARIRSPGGETTVDAEGACRIKAFGVAVVASNADLPRMTQAVDHGFDAAVGRLGVEPHELVATATATRLVIGVEKIDLSEATRTTASDDLHAPAMARGVVAVPAGASLVDVAAKPALMAGHGRQHHLQQPLRTHPGSGATSRLAGLSVVCVFRRRVRAGALSPGHLPRHPRHGLCDHRIAPNPFRPVLVSKPYSSSSIETGRRAGELGLVADRGLLTGGIAVWNDHLRVGRFTRSVCVKQQRQGSLG